MSLIKSKFYTKLIISCILLGTIPSVIIGAFSSIKASDMVQREVNQSNAWALSQAKISIETQLSSANAELVELYNFPAVSKANDLEMSGYNYETFNDIISNILNLPITDASFENVAVANLDENWVVNSGGVYGMTEYENLDSSIKAYRTIIQSSEWFDSLQIRKLTKSSQNVPYVTLVRKAQTPDNPYIVYLSISYSNLQNLISSNSQAGSIMVIDSSGCLLISPDLSKCGTDMSSTGLFKTISSNGRGSDSFIMSDGKNKVSVNYVKSSMNGWIYLSSYSVKKITEDSRIIGLFTASVCFALIAVICLVSLLISRQLYIPVRKIYKTVTEQFHDSAKSESGNDELFQIEENVNSLIHLQSKLKTQISKQTDQLKENFSVKLLIENLDGDYIDSKIRLFGYPAIPPTMAVFVTRIDSLKDTEFTENDLDLLLYAIKNIISELLIGKIVIAPVVYHEMQVSVIKEDTNFKDNAYEAAKKIQSTIYQAIHISVSIGISNLIHTYGDLHQGYKECQEALQSNMLLGKDNVAFIDDLRKHEKMKPVYPEEIEKDILDAVRSCDRVKCHEMIGQYMDSLFDIEANRYEYKVFIHRLLLNLLILHKETCGELSNDRKHSEDFMQDLYNLRSREEIENWLKNTVVESLITQIENAEGSRFNRICEKVISIIHNEYNTKLTLEDCAARLGYHPSYIRRILKKEMGINFSEYLTLYRVNLAKKWLVETEMKISEIAEKLKYENAENFIRWFKKNVGVTPGQYREKQEIHEIDR